MKILKALSLLAALALLGGAVLGASDGALKQVLGAGADAGKPKLEYIPASKAGPFIPRRETELAPAPQPAPQQQAQPAAKTDAGK